jgi:biotin carboxyl carrier protein
MTVGNRSYDIQVEDAYKTPMTVIVDGQTFRVDVQPREDGDALAAAPGRALSPEAPPTGAGGPTQVTAPMPGTILDIEVQAGDQVQQGQALCALDAMKMKSPIRAPRAGTVRQVQVNEGQTVDHGDLLVVVE